MPSPEKRKPDGPGPSNATKRLRSHEQNNNTVNGSSQSVPFTPNPEENDGKCGVLEWITVRNFMCHDHLNFEFSPHINFVQGRNGSGKSAILTAVVIGLGGMTRSTNRGSNLKELVKHGKQVATIEIGIKNSRSSAFKYDSYGKSIIVERRITVSSGGGYKIKSWDGTVVSTKKDELLRMLAHFNLQVDNPVTILNQDMSRSFFNTTEPKMLFKLFLKATQLQQMKDDYAYLENTIQSSLKIIESRKECLPELEKEVEEQRNTYQFSLSLREKGQKLKVLRHELAWAKIIENENEKAEAEKVLENHKKTRNVITEKIEALQQSLREESDMRETHVKQLREASQRLSDAARAVKEMDDEMRLTKNAYKDKQSQFNIAEKKTRVIASEISTLKAAVEKDNNKEQSEWAAVRAGWQKKMNEVEGQIKEVLVNLNTETTHTQNLQRTGEVKVSEKTDLEMEEKALHRKLNGFQRELKGLQNQKGSQVTVYGQWVPQLLNKMETAYSKGLFKKKPVGPMGAFIKVKDTKWAHVAERVLGMRISSFCVDNQADERVLRKLMKDVNFDQQPMPSVNVARFREKVLDVSRFEAVGDYPSLWSILDISNSVVANLVIDLLQVESILLIPTAQEAGRIMKDRTLVPRNCKFAYTLNLDQYYPDPNYRLYSGRGSCSAKFLQVSVEDRIREVNRRKVDCEENINSLTRQIQESQSEIRKLREEMNASNQKFQQFKKKLDTHRMAIAHLQNQETPSPPDVAQLEDDIRQQEECLEIAKAKMEEFRKSVQESKTKFSELGGFLLEVRQKEKDALKEVEARKIAQDQSNTDTAMSKIERYEKKDQELKKIERNLQRAVNEATQTLNAALKTAEAFNLGSRVETNKCVKELERLYTSLQIRLNKERATSGDPVVIAERYMTTKQRFKQVSEEINKHLSLIKKLKESLQMRESKYCRLHKWLAVIVKYFFKEHVSLRKLDGSISISLEDKTLKIHVEKPGTIKELPADDKKVKKRTSQAHQELIMMSGGERSFATVAFIIALWHAIVSPVRILDEFDVFMDVIARNHAMKMMISAAKPDTQYIFLTPLSLDTSKLRNCVFFKMPDPEIELEDA